ncbi:hypothetical protein BaRGS_00002576 [Batillaria attramentaria]|uniref:Secreted protein n=1 Tax=Batillaria attramentaria TaxID=370345 RepID=A0ABD0M3J3_9CAEN
MKTYWVTLRVVATCKSVFFMQLLAFEVVYLKNKHAIRSTLFCDYFARNQLSTSSVLPALACVREHHPVQSVVRNSTRYKRDRQCDPHAFATTDSVSRRNV